MYKEAAGYVYSSAKYADKHEIEPKNAVAAAKRDQKQADKIAAVAAAAATSNATSASGAPGGNKKRPLTDDDIFWGKPNKHIYNGYCPCCD